MNSNVKWHFTCTIGGLAMVLGTVLSACTIGTARQQEEETTYPLNQTELLFRDSSLNDYFDIGPEGITVYASPEDRMNDHPECHIYPQEYPYLASLFHELSNDSLLTLYLEKGIAPWPDSILEIKPDTLPLPADPSMPLQGLRVALDPGHVAGDLEMAEQEGKYVKMRASDHPAGKAIAFWEANLTLATAFVLKEKLEKLGATVMLTRDKPGYGARNMTYPYWRKHHFEEGLARAEEKGWIDPGEREWWRKKVPEKRIMKDVFNQEDLWFRAQKINAFQPDLTLIIHYNVDEPNYLARDRRGFFYPTEVNYLMAFVPGSFMKGELERAEERLALLRLLVTDDQDQSVRLSKAFIRHSESITQVPIVEADRPLNYLQIASIYTDIPGVFARNLSLTRMVHGPLCYGESLLQDNLSESQRLNQRDFIIEGVPAPKRVEAVAEAYLQAVLDFSGR